MFDYILKDSHHNLEKILSKKTELCSIVFIEGAKKVGKTTLVQEVIKDRPHIWINLEENKTLIREIDQSKDLKELQDVLGLRHGFVHGSGEILVIDQAHLSDKLPSLIPKIAQNWQNQRLILITSTSHNFIHYKTGDERNQIQRLIITPFRFIEFLKLIGEEYLYEELLNWKIDKPFTDTLHQRALEVLDAYLNIGGMPFAIHAYQQGLDWHDIINEIIFDYIDDYKKSCSNKNTEILEIALQKISQGLGSPGKRTNILPSSHKLYHHIPSMLEFLEKINLIYNVAIKSPGANKKNKIPPKRYLFDHGFRDHFSPITSQLMHSLTSTSRIPTGTIQGILENHVLCELKSRGFKDLISWRQKMNGSEVSFIIKSGSQFIPLDVKPSLKTNKKYFLSLLNCLEDLNLSKGVLFSADKGKIYYSDTKKILQVPFYCAFKL